MDHPSSTVRQPENREDKSAEGISANVNPQKLQPPTEVFGEGVTQAPKKLVSTETVLQRAEISRSYWYELRKADRCPAPIKLSPGRRGAVRYVDAEIDAWIASLIASRTRGVK